MQSIKHAFRFISASFSLALKHTKFQEPWFTLGLGSLAILFAWFLPTALVVALLGLTPLGLSLTGLLAVCVVSDLWVWGEMTSLLTAREMDNINNTPEEKPSSNIQFLKKYGMSIFTLVLAKPALLAGWAIKGLFTSKNKPLSDSHLWLKAHTLALPIVAIDRLPLKKALTRLRQVVKDNLLPIREKFIRVRLIAWLVQFLLLAGGCCLGFWLGFKLAGPEVTNPWQRIMAVGIAMLAAWVPTFIGILFSSYTRTCYATALYQWVQNVESARNSGNPETAQPPDILRRVLGSGRT